MTTQSISSVETLANTAIHTAECYNAAGKTLAGAYRTGVQRVARDVAVERADFDDQGHGCLPRCLLPAMVAGLTRRERATAGRARASGCGP